MKRTAAFLIATLLCFTPAIAQESPGLFERIFGGSESQDAEEDPGGFLERLIEDNLSGEGRDVEITGFEGALGGRGTFETFTISDPDGVWLTLRDVVVDWNRGALLRGRIEVAELSAASIELPRLPTPAEAEGPSPEAGGFSLPELPVSVSIEGLKVDRIEIGAPVFGVETAASLNGSLSLASGDGAATLDVKRLNGNGSLVLDTSYSNASENLALDLQLAEDADGIVANLLGLPGRPPLEFSIIGEAPLSEYTAEIALATEGQDRLQGQITTLVPQDTPGVTRTTRAALQGDIAPLFNADYQPFFGPNVSLNATITTFETGQTDISDLSVSAESLSLTGEIKIASGGLPTEIDVSGSIANATNTAVLLPLSGPETRVDAVDLSVTFDETRNDAWTGKFEIVGLDRPGFSADSLTLDASGQIKSQSPQSVTANLLFDASALDLGNPEAEKALGEQVQGQVAIDWTSGQPLLLRDLEISGESYAIVGDAEVSSSENGPSVAGEVVVSAADLSVFSGIAQRNLGGAAELATEFTSEPLAGFFNVTARGTTNDLFVSQQQADAVLAGNVNLNVRAQRTTSGTFLIIEELQSPNAGIRGSAALRTGASRIDLDARLQDAALVLPQVTGPVRVTLEAAETDGVWEWVLDSALDRTLLSAAGTATAIFDTPIIAATGRLAADDLSDFSDLARRRLSGSVDTRFTGDLVVDLSRASLNLDGTASDLNIGQSQVDALLSGDVRALIDVALADEVITLRESSISGPAGQIEADGTLSASAGSLSVSGRITELSDILVSAPSGPAIFAVTTERSGNSWTYDLSTEAPSTRLESNGVVNDPTGANPSIDAMIDASFGNLGVFSDLVGRPISGVLEIDAAGFARSDLSEFEVNADLRGNTLRTGISSVDRVLSGDVTASVEASRDGEAINIVAARFSSPLARLEATGALGPIGSAVEIDGRLENIAPFVEGFSGPASVAGTITQQENQSLLLNLDASGPGGARAAVVGDAMADGSAVDLDIDGLAPLGLINPLIEPRSVAGNIAFDLRLEGAPTVQNLSGRVTSSDARLVAPTLGLILEETNLNASLNAARASISAVTNVSSGGQIGIDGQLGLLGDRDADLDIRLNQVVLIDPQLYETEISGVVSVDGPLAGGALIGGNLNLGETNIRIPSSGFGGTGAIPEIIHINEPPPVRRTRARAGLLEEDGNGTSASGPVFPLDIGISAPNRIFVRGRGLDSEFGGSLRIRGTTRDVIPQGAFNLIRGRLDILGQRLAIEEATASILGSFVPVLRIRATTDAEDVQVAVIVAGRADSPEITFTSNPELPQEEILSLLLFGRELQSLSPIQAGRLALAVRTLTGQGGEGIVGNVRDGAGLADFDVTSDDDGNAAVRAGAYLGENLYTDVTVTATGETELNLNLDINRSVTLKGSTATGGDTSVGIFFERDY